MEKKEITTFNTGALQPKLQPLTVLSWLYYLSDLFCVSEKRNIKRGNFQKFTDLCLFKEVAEASEKFDHEYNKIKQMVDWLDFKEKRAQKACKGEFFKKQLLSQMQLVNTNQLAPEKYQQNNESVCETSKDVDTLGKCVRQQYKYESS